MTVLGFALAALGCTGPGAEQSEPVADNVLLAEWTGPYGGVPAFDDMDLAALKPGDTMLGMDLTHGGHLTHGHPLNYSGKEFEVVAYGVDKETETIDYDRLRELAVEHRPKLIVCGASAYPRTIDFERLRAIADEAADEIERARKSSELPRFCSPVQSLCRDGRSHKGSRE